LGLTCESAIGVGVGVGVGGRRKSLKNLKNQEKFTETK